MSLPELCIRRPVMTTLLMLSFIAFGLIGYRQLPVSALPQVDFPTIQIEANLNGASPETMASAVAAPIERQLATVSGISAMTSSSSRGSTTITVQFDLNRNIDGASLDVAAALSAVQKNLPPTMTSAPSFRKVNPADFPVLLLALSSDTLPLSRVDDYGEQVFAQQISQLSGVAQVIIFGQQKYAVRAEVDPDKAAARGITLADVGNAVAAANSSTPVGTQYGEKQNITLDASGQLQKAADFRHVVVAFRNGAPVMLDQIAKLKDSVTDTQTAAWFNNKRAVILAIFRQSDANTVKVVDQIRASLPKYNAQIPPSVHDDVLNDRSVSIRDSIADVQETLALSVALVVLVIFFFLKSVPATLIPALALPVSLIGTFGFMFAFGYSIDNISLLAITLSVGFVVDDAIVMLENIVRHVENGMKPFEAALKGAGEIAFTILSMTLSLVAVFIPVLFMGDVVGRVFREFAVTISVAILVSGFVSLTLTPMLCARLLRPINHEARQNAFARFSDFVVNGVQRGYQRSLNWVLHVRPLILLLTFVTIGASLFAYYIIPKGFFPTEDTGFLLAATEASPDTSLAAMAVRQKQLSAIVRKDPAVLYAVSAIGGITSANQGRMFVALKPKGERPGLFTMVGRLRKEAAAVPGLSAIFIPIQNLNLQGGRPARAAYQYTLQSTDLAALYPDSNKMMLAMRKLPGLRDVNTDLQIRNPVAKVIIDRQKAAALGVSADQIRATLNNAYGSRVVSTIYTQAAEYDVIVESDSAFQNHINALGRLDVRSQSGALVPLNQVSSLVRQVGPLSVNRQSQQPSVTLSFNLAPGVSIGAAITEIHAAERKLNLPASVTTSFSGTAQLFQKSLQGQGVLLIAAILTIYIVLGVLYESFIHPVTILSGLPSAGLGALIALALGGRELTVIAIIGILMLVGIVKKNAIMMIDFAIERRLQGDDALTAIREAAVIRFRPIMMTTLCAMLGTMPIALGTGAGSELRQPLGIAVVGGLFVSQILTLYITPVIYFYLDKIDSRLAGRRTPRPKLPESQDPLLAEAAE